MENRREMYFYYIIKIIHNFFHTIAILALEGKRYVTRFAGFAESKTVFSKNNLFTPIKINESETYLLGAKHY